MIEEGELSDKRYSIFTTIVWMLFLAFGIQTILGFIVAIAAGASGAASNELELVFLRPDTIAITGVISALLAFPLIKKAKSKATKSFPFEFLAFQPISRTTLVKVLFAGVGYYIFSALISSVLSIETPQFMVDVKAQTHTIFDGLMLVLGICIVAPIVEEIIFRGLGYGRLIQSRAGVSGAILITSLVFTAIHIQYDFIVLAILSVFAFLVGYVRYKTNNLIYCIALHMQLNIFSTIELFVFF